MDFATLREAILHLPDLIVDINNSINYNSLHKVISGLSNERRSLPPDIDKIEMARFREQFFPVVHSSTFCKYVYDKPRGYAGDFVTQEMIWLGRTIKGKYLYDGSSRVGELINAFTFDMANCRANEERIYRLQKYISQSGPRLMSIGCGSCIELWDWQNDHEAQRQVVLVDQDEGALQHAQLKLASSEGLQVAFQQANVLKYILGKDHLQCGPRDLIYLFGLMDYFPLKSARRLVQALWPCVASGGMMVVTNAHPSNSTRLWMEYVGDWFLDYKTEEMMYDLAAGLPGSASLTLVMDNQGVYQYLEIRA